MILRTGFVGTVTLVLRLAACGSDGGPKARTSVEAATSTQRAARSSTRRAALVRPRDHLLPPATPVAARRQGKRAVGNGGGPRVPIG